MCIRDRNRERLMKKIHVLLGQIDDVIAREKSSDVYKRQTLIVAFIRFWLNSWLNSLG